MLERIVLIAMPDQIEWVTGHKPQYFLQDHLTTPLATCSDVEEIQATVEDIHSKASGPSILKAVYYTGQFKRLTLHLCSRSKPRRDMHHDPEYIASLLRQYNVPTILLSVPSPTDRLALNEVSLFAQQGGLLRKPS